MSFNLAAYSQEIKNAIDFATLNGVISVAAAGNQGQDALVYPAAYKNVISVASTTNDDQRSSFSNYGSDLIWVGAPGEGIVTTYPFGTYAAGWGTSFSAPFVSGGAALMLDYSGSLLMDLLIFQNQSDEAQAVAHAKPLGPDLGHGRLDIIQALTAWRSSLGVRGTL
jgi:thermitase